jgi:1,4-dihydroxy-6-naphthoate synthase
MMKKNKFSLGFSPCPNDTFIFDALVNGKIDTEGLEFEVILEDVQTLNNRAKEGRLDVSKISYGVLPLLLEHYTVLSSGGALGKGVGPLLIGPLPASPEGGGVIHPKELADLVNESIIAIPGENTTAHFLFNQAFPNAKNKVFLRFDEIENWLLNFRNKRELNESQKALPLGEPARRSGGGLGGAGVIIHENRFTYQQKGLYKWLDLGELWERTTGFPIPLGGIVIRKSIDTALQQKIDRLIRKSLEYAFENYPHLTDYVKMHSQEMSEDVMRQHIDLYVNDFSLDMGETGRAAVLKLLDAMMPAAHSKEDIFIAPQSL